MWALAGSTGLDVNSPYAYVLWPHHHPETTVVAERDGVLVGFVLGYLVPAARCDVFVWQVAVAPEARSSGLAGQMLDSLCGRLRPDALEATVTPSNEVSAALFGAFARRHGGELTVTRCFDAALFPADHEPEDLHRIELPRPMPSQRSRP